MKKKWLLIPLAALATSCADLNSSQLGYNPVVLRHATIAQANAYSGQHPGLYTILDNGDMVDSNSPAGLQAIAEDVRQNRIARIQDAYHNHSTPFTVTTFHPLGDDGATIEQVPGRVFVNPVTGKATFWPDN